MSLMAEAYGADIRLVALMQYLRVVCVATTASIVAAIWAHGGGPRRPNRMVSASRAEAFRRDACCSLSAAH